MIQVAALTSGKNDPTSRFRVRQFIEPLHALGISLSEYYPLLSKYITKRVVPLGLLTRLPGVAAGRAADVTLLGRELLAGRLTLESYTGPKRIFDVDDAIWLNGSGFSERIARLCDGVIAGNRFIADHYRKHGARVWEIPTSLDTARWKPDKSMVSGKWTIGWTGTSSNLKYLYAIEEPLADFLAEHSGSELLVVSNRKPRLRKLPAQSWRFVRWSAQCEVRLVQSMHAGLMPLANDEWSLGKCALKMLMYMSVGIPSVVSPVGVAAEILDRRPVALAARSADDWYEMLKLLRDDRTATQIGAEARNVAEEEFSVNRNAPKLAAVICEVARRPV